MYKIVKQKTKTPSNLLWNPILDKYCFTETPVKLMPEFTGFYYVAMMIIQEEKSVIVTNDDYIFPQLISGKVAKIQFSTKDLEDTVIKIDNFICFHSHLYDLGYGYKLPLEFQKYYCENSDIEVINVILPDEDCILSPLGKSIIQTSDFKTFYLNNQLCL